jgi:AraC-like DNA-binding protein
MRFVRRYHQKGLPPHGKLTFGIPVAGLRSWLGHRYRLPGVLPFNLPGGIDGISESGFEAFTLSLGENFLDEIATSFQIPMQGRFQRPTTQSMIEPDEHASRLRGLLFRLASRPDRIVDPETEEEVVSTLLHAGLSEPETRDRSNPKARSRAVRVALDHMADHADEAVSLRDICKENGVALRTLNRAFNERFGIGPKAYLKRRRLSAVRDELQHAPPELSITSIANRWGFWHMGQFARDYRQLFGELPSATRNRKPH